MASPLVARALNACLIRSARTIFSVSLPHRSFKITSGPIAAAVKGIRHSSAAAALAEQDEETLKESLPTFDSLEGIVDNGLLKAIKDMKITTMSPVQAQVFPLLPELARPYDPQEPSAGPPRDLLVKAKTGTGKTLGFLLPAVEARLKALAVHGKQAARDAGKEDDLAFANQAASLFARKSVGTLIISPTRELATQIANEAMRFTGKLDRENRNFGVRLFVGGENKRRQVSQFLNLRNDIVVATPGRLRDVLQSEPEIRKAIAQTQVLILDEADTLLDMGFRPDIDAIEKIITPKPERQTFLFSATVSRAIQDIAQEMLSTNHKFINCVSSDASPVHAHVPQYSTIISDAREQIPHIVRLIAHDQLSNPGASKIVLFLPTTKQTQLYSTLLRELKTALPARNRTHIYEIHSKKTMESRVKASSYFRNDKEGASILVSSDVSARGVDYPGVSRVIQVGSPGSTEQYIHRVGRTGRAGTEGRGDLVLSRFEQGFLRNISNVPLKALSTETLASQVLELANVHDSDPDAFFAHAPKVQSSRYSGRLFENEVVPVVEEINSAVDNLKSKVDPEAVNETFMSLLGFYLSRISVVGTSVESIVKSLQDWATDGLGLSLAPFVSDALLKRMAGPGTGKRSSFGQRGSFGIGGRGQFQSRDRGFGAHSGAYRSRDEESFGNRSHREGSGYRPHHGRDGESSGYRPHYARDGESSGYRSSGYRPHYARDGGSSDYRPHYARDGESSGFRPRQVRDGESGGSFTPRSRDENSEYRPHYNREGGSSSAGQYRRSFSKPSPHWMGRGSARGQD
ncbi:hypothetical protein C0993_001052 [Termitomyces sp. T159_Od127]|nr:hypothetical protein C0993_001052 [Termitomyces sp. T159_Od127]